MNNGNYQKAYKKSYNDKNKIVTFPLSVAFHDELKRRAIYDTPEAFFKDLLEHGCISWMVSSLIYHKDTHEFYDKHYVEIEDIRCQLASDWIEVNFPECTDLKNFYAWLSFEQRAYELNNTLEMDGR